MAEKWYNLTPEQTAARLSSDLERGLEPKQASQRLRREGKNTVYKVQRPLLSELARDVLRDPCAYILLASALLAWIFGERVGAPLIILITLINAAVVLGAYIKARSVIADARGHSIPTATVIRGGRQYLIKPDRLCRGDIIILNKGDVVPCDARIIESYDLYTLEVNLMGTLGRVKKDARLIHANNLSADKQADMVFATTVVARGSAKAIVCETGEETLAAIMHKTVDTGKEKASLGVLSILKRHCSGWSIFMLVMVFILTLTEFVIGYANRSIFEVFITGLSVAAAGMCEYYLVFGYIIIGCGLYGMLHRSGNEGSGAVVKNIGDIDRLSDITALILPQRGAFVAGSIRMKHLYTDGTLYAPNEKNLNRSCPRLISAAFDTTVYPENDYEKVYNRFKARDASTEDRAILSVAAGSSVFDGPAYMGAHIPVSRKTDGAVIRSLVMVNGKNTLSIRGKAEDILPLCSRYRSAEQLKLIKNEKSRVTRTIEELDRKGIYSVCVASLVTDDIDASGGFVFEGFLAINKPELAGAKETMTKLREAGIKVFLLTDTALVTHRSQAKALGIIEDDSQVLTRSRLNTMSEAELFETLGDYRMLEEASSRHISMLVNVLKKQGETVGYFGCDFDDISILKEADIGYASGITLTRGNSVIDLGAESSPVFIRSNEEKTGGSEALKQVCDVIVSPADGNRGGFNAIAASISRSKQVFYSLAGSMRYLIASQCARLILFLYSAVIPDSLFKLSSNILSPVQILLSGLIADLLVVMAFAFATSDSSLRYKVEHKSLSPGIKPMLTGVVWALAALIPPIALKLLTADMTESAMSSMIFFGFLISQGVAALENTCERSVFTSLRISRRRLILAAAGITVFILLSALFGLFGCSMLGPIQWAATLFQPLCVLATYEIYKIIKEKKNDRNKND